MYFWGGHALHSFEKPGEMRCLLKMEVAGRRFDEFSRRNLFGSRLCSQFVQPPFRRAAEQEKKMALQLPWRYPALASDLFDPVAAL